MPQQPASRSITSAPGIAAGASEHRARRRPATADGSAPGPGCAAGPARNAGRGSAVVRQERVEALLERQAGRGDGLGPGAQLAAEQGGIVVLDRQDAARLAGDDRPPRARPSRRARSTLCRALATAWSSRPLEISGRPQQRRPGGPSVTAQPARAGAARPPPRRPRARSSSRRCRGRAGPAAGAVGSGGRPVGARAAARASGGRTAGGRRRRSIPRSFSFSQRPSRPCASQFDSGRQRGTPSGPGARRGRRRGCARGGRARGDTGGGTRP